MNLHVQLYTVCTDVYTIVHIHVNCTCTYNVNVNVHVCTCTLPIVMFHSMR